MENLDFENNNEKVVYRHRIILRAPKAKAAKKTEEAAGEWKLLPAFEEKVWMPELKAPKIELPPRKSAAERFEAFPAVIEARKEIAAQRAEREVRRRKL